MHLPRGALIGSLVSLSEPEVSTQRNRFAPVRVQDPVSEGHAVPLKPGQDIEILLSGSNDRKSYFDDIDISIRSDYLKIANVRSDKGGLIYTISQTRDFSDWSRVSSTYLGEIKFSKDKFKSTLCVSVDATNPFKKNIVTVVNPNSHLVKTTPYQIIEVVLYNPVWGKPLYWDLDKDSDPRMELVAYSYIQPNVYRAEDSVRKINDAFFTYPRSQHDSNRPFFEYHFWVRCQQSAAKHMQSLPNGMFPNAKLRFVGYVNVEEKVSCDLEVVFSTKPRKDPSAERTLAVTAYDSDMTRDVKIKGASYGPKGKEILLVQDLVKRRDVYGNGVHDWKESYNRSGYSQMYDHEPSPPQREWCSKQKFDIRLDNRPMWEGTNAKFLDEINANSCPLVIKKNRR